MKLFRYVVSYVLIVSFLLILFPTISVFAAESPMYSAYKKVLLSNPTTTSDISLRYDHNTYYTLYDIDKNGVPELLIFLGYRCCVYTYDSKSAIFCGELRVGPSIFEPYAFAKNGIVLVNLGGSMGIPYIMGFYELNGVVLEEKNISEEPRNLNYEMLPYDFFKFSDYYLLDELSFQDVPVGAYYESAINWAVENGITTGTSTTTFSPSSIVTRAQAVTFLWRAMGEPKPKATNNPFTDIKSGAWYFDAVLWAVEKGITKGTSATKFSPNGSVTRGQMITFLYRAMGEPGKTGTGAWYADAESWASRQRLLLGTSAIYTTNADCPRSDVIYYLWKAFINPGSGSDNETLYIPVIQTMLSGNGKNETSSPRYGTFVGYVGEVDGGFLYDIDEDGFRELFLIYTVDESDIPSLSIPARYCSVFDVENGAVVTKIKDARCLQTGEGMFNIHVAKYNGEKVLHVELFTYTEGGETWGMLYDGIQFNKIMDYSDIHPLGASQEYRINGSNYSKEEYFDILNQIKNIELPLMSKIELLSQLTSS